MNDDHRLPPIDLRQWLVGGIISLITITLPIHCVITERHVTKLEESIKINNS